MPTAAARSGAWLKAALVALAESDPAAAGRLATELAPFQADALGVELDGYVLLDRLGVWRVTPAGAVAAGFDEPRTRRTARFSLAADPSAFVDLVAGNRRLRGRPRIRVRGSRRRARRLRGLGDAPVGLAEVLRAGADFDAALAWRAVAAAIHPAWTSSGPSFAVAVEVPGEQRFGVRVAAGAPVEVATEPRSRPPRGASTEPAPPPVASIRGSNRAIVALLAGTHPEDGDKASIRGDLEAVRVLQRLTERAQDSARNAR